MTSQDWDFVINIGPTAPEVEPDNVLKTAEANQALHDAYEGACAKANSSVYALNAKAYIENIELNRIYETNADKADVFQLNYIIANLQHWRGDKAREAKKILNAYCGNA